MPVLIKEGPPEENPWAVKFATMFHMSNDSGLFRTREQLESDGWQLQGNTFRRGSDIYLPLYEAKMFHQFDHRWATYEGLDTRDLPIEEKNSPHDFALPRYWVPMVEVDAQLKEFKADWLVAFRDITNTTNERTAIFNIIPRVGVGHTAPLVFFDKIETRKKILFVSNLGSYCLDYSTRQKIGGTHLTYGFLKQLPILPPNIYTQPCKWGVGNRENPTPHSLPPYSRFLLPRVLELTYTAWDLQPFAQDCGYHGAPFRWDEERRFLLRCELDAAYFHLYGIAREDVAYIMETFPIVKRKDEKAHGEYRTQRVILEIFDAMQQAIATGQPYQTRLNPPPADPRVAHPWDPAFGPVPEQVWVETASDERRVTSGEMSANIAETRPPYTTSEALILQNPVAKINQPKKSKAGKVAQNTFMEVMPAPDGPYNVRLKRAMALGGDPSPIATRELVAFLADEDSNIRWLAGSSLVQRAGIGGDTVTAIAAFLDRAGSERVERARSEALRVLGLIADTAEEESVRVAAGEVLEKFTND